MKRNKDQLSSKNINFFLFVIGFQFFWFQSCTSEKDNSSIISTSRDTGTYTAIMGDAEVGHLIVENSNDTVYIDWEYKNNGRGPSIKEAIVLDEKGYPIFWDIKGNSAFGNQVAENFKMEDHTASWTDGTGSGTLTIDHDAFYIGQFTSPYALAMIGRVLLQTPNFSFAALPTGQLQLNKIGTFQTDSANEQIQLTSYSLSGANLDPYYFVLDDKDRFFAYISSGFVVIRKGFENEGKRFQELAASYLAAHYERLQSQFAHHYENEVRIRNVRIYDPHTLGLTKLSSVLIKENRIIDIELPESKGKETETIIEGNGGTLVPGLYDMHGHVSVRTAFLNIAAGVTSVRDMGNHNEVLEDLIGKIESGILSGPKITRLGLIEGKSPHNLNMGVVVNSKQEAIEAVAAYAEKEFHGIKLYNSMKGEWAAEIVAAAHKLNLTVTGHVPAFSNANAMIRAGFDELTHINQVMLGWVLEPHEDTRTLLRLTALMRLPNLDLESTEVQETLDLMVKHKVAIDPTLAIHEDLLLSRNGEIKLGTLDYFDHMPPSVQRDLKVGKVSISNVEEDSLYRLAYEKILATLKLIKDRGIQILPGTDLGGAFTLHRELELYQQLGYSPAELLKLASYDMASYLGHKDRGTIEPGMLADFFLVPKDPTKDFKAIKSISMVSRGGVIYYPSELYPAFGIKPFVETPVVKSPNQ